MKPPTNRFAGLVIECSGISNLLDFPLVENNYLVPHCHRFNLVMCDVDDGGIESVVQPTNLHPHLHTQLRIKIAQRFIKEEDFWDVARLPYQLRHVDVHHQRGVSVCGLAGVKCSESLLPL